MDESKLRTIAQIEEFLKATQEVGFTGVGGTADDERYAHILAPSPAMGANVLGLVRPFACMAGLLAFIAKTYACQSINNNALAYQHCPSSYYLNRIKRNPTCV